MLIIFCIFLIGVVVFFVQVGREIHIIALGKPSHRTDVKKQRLFYALKLTLGQKRITEKPWGWAHVVLMWAFLVFLTAGLEMLIACILPHFTWKDLFGDAFHALLCLVQTWFAWAAILGLCVVSTRRIVARKFTYTNFDAIFILADIFILMAAHIICMSALIAQHQVTEWAVRLMPFERCLSDYLSPHAMTLHDVFSALHLIMMAIFLCWIPNSKHLHILFGWPDAFFAYKTWFKDGTPSFSPDPVNFDTYEAECTKAIEENAQIMPTIGLRTFSDTTQKQRLEAFSCTKCMRCTNVCPMVSAGLDDKGPMQTLIHLREMCRKNNAETPLIPTLISSSALWNCTQCGACDRACPLSHEHALRILMMRQNAVAQQENVPSKLDKCFANVERSGNPWGYPKKDRTLLLNASPEDTSVHTPHATFTDKFGTIKRIALFAGCMASYDKRASKTLNAVHAWLKISGFDVVLMPKETCCGEPLRKTGNEFGFETQARANIETLNALQVDLVLTTCPHCAFTLNDSYRDYGFNTRVMHIVQLWHTMMDNNSLKIQKTEKGSIALHMPCYLSKYAEETNTVLKLLNAAGYDVRLAKNAALDSCCGAGGGRFFFTEDRSIANNRIQTLDKLGAPKLAALCPYCVQMLNDALQNSDVRSLTTSFNVIDELAGCVLFSPATH